MPATAWPVAVRSQVRQAGIGKMAINRTGRQARYQGLNPACQGPIVRLAVRELGCFWPSEPLSQGTPEWIGKNNEQEIYRGSDLRFCSSVGRQSAAVPAADQSSATG